MDKSHNEHMITPQQLPRADPCAGTLQCNFRIAKADEEQQLIFGWASVAKRADGEVVTDWQDDIIEIGELEAAAYDYVLHSREGGERHERGGTATLIESFVVTKEKQAALGIPDGILPEGWIVGFKVTDEAVWKKIKNGTYSCFSIEGRAVREKIDERR